MHWFIYAFTGLLTAALFPKKNGYFIIDVYPLAYVQRVPKPSTYKVIGIKDGDTFVVLMNGKAQVVRLAHIDCPEKKQPFGAKAKQFVSQASFGKKVILIHQNKYDRNHRLIAEVVLTNGRNLNKELVKNGLAWHFKKYSHDKIYAALENQARKERVGLWQDRHAIAPWDWRRPARKTASRQH